MLNAAAKAPDFVALERGKIAFVARPRVNEDARVQRLYVLFEADRSRRVVIGRNRLPKEGGAAREERLWAWVDRVGATRDELMLDLGESTYETKTRGLRHRAAARVICEGEYEIARHGDHTHVVYDWNAEALADDPLARGLEIAREGSLIVAVFNPLAKWSREAITRHGGDPADSSPWHEPTIFPDELQAKFGERRFAPLEPALLDYEGCELVIMSAPR